MLLYRDGRFGVVVAAATVGGEGAAVAVAVVDCDGIADTEGIGVGGVEQEAISCCCCWSSSSSGITKVVAEARADRKAVSLGGIGDEEEDMRGWGGNLMRFKNGKREAKAEEGRKEKKIVAVVVVVMVVEWHPRFPGTQAHTHTHTHTMHIN